MDDSALNVLDEPLAGQVNKFDKIDFFKSTRWCKSFKNLVIWQKQIKFQPNKGFNTVTS
jgi:hypothetical protein